MSRCHYVILVLDNQWVSPNNYASPTGVGSAVVSRRLEISRACFSQARNENGKPQVKRMGLLHILKLSARGVFVLV